MRSSDLPTTAAPQWRTTAVANHRSGEPPKCVRPAASSVAYLVFQPLRFTCTTVASNAVGSYPAFSPFPPENRSSPMVVYSLWHYLSTFGCPYAAFLLGSKVLCVARTFLVTAPKRHPATGRTVSCKNSYINRQSTIHNEQCCLHRLKPIAAAAWISRYYA